MLGIRLHLFAALWIAAALPVAAQSDIKVRIAYPSGMNGLYATVMERAGLAKKHGLDAEVAFFQFGPPMMEAMASGAVDVVITSLMPVTSFLSQQPGRATVIAQLGQFNTSHSLMVPKGSPLAGLKDLAGKRIAVSYSTDSHVDLLAALRNAGLDAAKDVRLLNTPPQELMLSLSQNFSDAILIRQPQVNRMEAQFGARVIQTWPIWYIVIARNDFLQKNPEARARVLAALRESMLYTSLNKEQVSVWFGERLRLDAKVVLEVFAEDKAFGKFTRIDQINVDLTPPIRKTLEDWFKLSLEFGLIKQPVKSSF
jgi:ABC-type nitrate/sulfonate/bicarbonate transport system substrate-binding protein